ncbi:MAG: hypothetical protein AAGA60_04650, partial [Cyanobacteria bacterium P01_E01_bin.42]
MAFRLTQDGLRKVQQKFNRQNISQSKFAKKVDLDRGIVGKIINKNESVNQKSIRKIFEGLELGNPVEGVDYEKTDKDSIEINSNSGNLATHSNFRKGDGISKEEVILKPIQTLYIKRYEANSQESLT